MFRTTRDKNVHAMHNTLLVLQKLTSSNARTQFLKDFFAKMKKIGAKVDDIAKSLQSVNCSLTDVVSIHNTQLTKAFLQQNALGSTDSYKSVRNAMEDFNMQQVRTLLTHGPFFEKRRMYFLKCLLIMSTKSKPGSSSVIKSFARQILHWNVLSKNEISVIEHILKRANEENLRILLESGIIPHVKKCSDCDVFVHIFGNPAAVELMKNEKFDVNVRGYNGQTALHIGVANKIANNVEFLLRRGADPNAKDDDGETPMFEALWSTKNPNLSVKCVELLLLYGADVQTCDYGGVSFIYYAARTGATLDLLELVLCHLAMREAMGLTIEQLIFDQIGARERSRVMFENCREKLEETKVLEVCERVTMFEMITESVKKRINAVDCKAIVEFLDRRKDCNRFFENVVRHRLGEIVRMNDLKCKARIVIFESMETLRPYDLVIDKIVSFLSYKDLCAFE